jgi:hypothetical protein
MIAILLFLRSLRYRFLPTTRRQATAEVNRMLTSVGPFGVVLWHEMISNPYGFDAEIVGRQDTGDHLALPTTVLFRCLSVENWTMHALFVLVSCYCCWTGVTEGEWVPALAGLALWPGTLFIRFVTAAAISPKFARMYRKLAPGAMWIGPTSWVS